MTEQVARLRLLLAEAMSQRDAARAQVESWKATCGTLAGEAIAAEAERDALRAQVEAALSQHVRVAVGSEEWGDWRCINCCDTDANNLPWPCPTVAALSSSEPVTAGPACDSCGRDWALRFSPDHGANFCDGCFERENPPAGEVTPPAEQRADLDGCIAKRGCKSRLHLSDCPARPTTEPVTPPAEQRDDKCLTCGSTEREVRGWASGFRCDDPGGWHAPRPTTEGGRHHHSRKAMECVHNGADCCVECCEPGGAFEGGQHG